MLSDAPLVIDPVIAPRRRTGLIPSTLRPNAYPTSTGVEVTRTPAATRLKPDCASVSMMPLPARRLRLEERVTELDGWVFAMRLRYRLDTKIPLNTYTLEPGAFYVPLAIEFFADLVDEAPEFFAKRTRTTVGLGYVINKNWTLDLRYHRQRSRATIEGEFKTSTNVIDFSVKSSFRIRDLVKGR